MEGMRMERDRMAKLRVVHDEALYFEEALTQSLWWDAEIQTINGVLHVGGSHGCRDSSVSSSVGIDEYARVPVSGVDRGLYIEEREHLVDES
jgi:hypothetical protein